MWGAKQLPGSLDGSLACLRCVWHWYTSADKTDSAGLLTTGFLGSLCASLLFISAMLGTQLEYHFRHPGPIYAKSLVVVAQVLLTWIPA